MGEHGRKAGGGAATTLACALLLMVSTAADAEGRAGAIPAAGDRFDARQSGRWGTHIREASARFGIPEDWIRRVMRAESGGRTLLDGRPITSRAGAMGLMQLMPGTWAEMREKHGLGADPHNPRDNILAGAAYLRAMHDRFGYPGLFAAYNAGPTRYAEHLHSGRRLPAETLAYVAAVGSASPGDGAILRNDPATSGIFVSRLSSRSRSSQAAPDTIFVRLRTASEAIE